MCPQDQQVKKSEPHDAAVQALYTLVMDVATANSTGEEPEREFIRSLCVSVVDSLENLMMDSNKDLERKVAGLENHSHQYRAPGAIRPVRAWTGKPAPEYQ